MNFVDFLAILPYVISTLIESLQDLHILGKAGKIMRLVRVMRILRIFKLGEIDWIAQLKETATVRRLTRDLTLNVLSPPPARLRKSPHDNAN